MQHTKSVLEVRNSLTCYVQQDAGRPIAFASSLVGFIAALDVIVQFANVLPGVSE